MIEYTGSLSEDEAMPILVKKAVGLIKAQRDRCNREKNASYKSYGAKGIKVEYTTRQFVGWFIANIGEASLNTVSVGRINHSKNYTIDNIAIETISSNSSESAKRNRHPKFKYPKKILVKKISDGSVVECVGQYEAAKITGLTARNISRYLSGARKQRNPKYLFEYAEAA